ncbi:MAG: 3-hydroxyisobutyrate dehydrogenase [Chloroflexota bacterium]|nr:3-hydroxyisobutyrate dehydrogenase [Chloroflexota bacterium]
MTEKLHIGFIGLGTMGKPMARRLLRAGYSLTVHNRSRESVEELSQEGATPAFSPREVGEASDVVITMLPSSPNVREVVLGPDGVLEGISPGGIIIDMSTINPLVTREIAAEAQEKGVKMLDGPVSGGPSGAEAGTLTIMVGGEEEVLEACRPILAVLGERIYHVGGVGMGEVVKVCNNLILASSMAAVGEAFALGVKAGADPKDLYEVITHSSGSCACLETGVPYPGVISDGPADKEFAPRFTLDMMFKDVGLGLDAAKDLKVPLPVVGAAYQMYNAARGWGYGGKDFSAVARVVQRITEQGEGDG